MQFDGLSDVLARVPDMLHRAREDGKRVPSLDELLPHVRADCPTCGVLFGPAGRGRIFFDSPSLQHWPDGSVSIICHGCNSRHSNGKRFVLASSVPVGHKWCARCETVKALGAFSVRRSSEHGRQPYCVVCDRAANRGFRARRAA